MGYRSEVSITLQNADFDRLVSEAKAQSKEAVEYLKYAEFFRNDLFTTMCFDWIKWYEGEEGINFIESFICDIPHAFYRIGEDNNDNDYSSNLDGLENFAIYDCVQFVRKLDVSGAGKQIRVDLNSDVGD